MNFGCDEFKELKSVVVHRPTEKALNLVKDNNCEKLLFDWVPDADQFIEEHNRYTDLLESHGITVYYVHDYVRENAELLEKMPNLHYVHDTAVISKQGAILSKMAFNGHKWLARKDEDIVMREVLVNMGIPIFFDFDEGDCFEGCLLLSPETILVAHTERHNIRAIRKFIAKAIDNFSEIIYVDIPKARRYMHPDTIYNRVKPDLAIAYPPAFLKTVLYTKEGEKEIDFFRFMQDRGIKTVNVSDSEQQRLACSFVPVRPGVIFHYDTALDDKTKSALVNKGVELILFHPDALLAGGGSLRCMTLRLWRS